MYCMQCEVLALAFLHSLINVNIIIIKNRIVYQKL